MRVPVPVARWRRNGQKMSKIISIANQKGGVGKTTTAINLAASLALAEKKTLLLDCDSQGNTSSGLGLAGDDIRGRNLYHALIGETPLAEVIRPTPIPHLELAPADQDLIGAEIEFVQLPDRERVLRKLLRSLDGRHEFIIIDCPPSLGLLTLNALVATDVLIVPLQCEFFAMEGLGHLLGTVKLIKARWNPSLVFAGILLTMFDARNSLSHRVAEDVRRNFGTKVFNTVIPRNVRLSESQSHGLPIILYDVRSRGALAYMELAREILMNGRI
jgi:chromosome partitioning protein